MNEVWHGNSRELAPQIAEHGPINCVVARPAVSVDFQSRRAETPETKRFAKDVANDGDLAVAIRTFDEVMDALPLCAEQAELYAFTRWGIVGGVDGRRCADSPVTTSPTRCCAPRTRASPAGATSPPTRAAATS
jgi:hypothetical protein